MALPKVIYIYEDGKGPHRCLIASDDPGEQNSGLVGIYDLREILQVRHELQIRRPKTEKWFPASLFQKGEENPGGTWAEK